MNKREVGSIFEQKAADYLIQNGYKILTRNFRCKIGEIDLIATSEGYLCFIEVKYRSNTHTGLPGEAINFRKILKINRTAEYYLLTHKLPQDTPCRFDVVIILENEISLIKNAFEGLE